MSRLQYWETLSQAKLATAVQAEQILDNQGELSFEEKQLLSAARDRLLSWKAPHHKREEEDTMRVDDENKLPQSEETTLQASSGHATTEPAEAKGAPKKGAAGASKPKETTVKTKIQGKAKAVKGKAAKATKATKPAKKANGNGAGRIPQDAKILWVAGKEIPFREGTEAYERSSLVQKASGKTREAIEKIKGVRGSTVPTLVNMGCARVG